ncbi:PKD domain-containing protein [Blastococcus litoris]|uniref:PKD domain-containing protein n=1 Tax=Blastococcus litoris TaxID=2171622 RepID=UPI000E2FF6E3|nr:PKD domain-containing protein [Blastococcus litoris]
MRIRSIAPLAVLGLVLGVVAGGTGANGAAEPGVVHFTSAGDFGASANTRAVLSAMDDQDPDLAVTVGDLSYGATGAEQQWCDLVTSEVGAGFPFELLAGNHESNGLNGNINDFSACLPNQLPGLVGTYGRQYYVDVPQVDPLVRFVMISPNLGFPDGQWNYPAGSARYEWTAAAIDGARSLSIPWVVVGMHKPCLSLGQYTCEIGADLMQLVMSKKVDLVLNGHEHLYQRTHQLGLRTGCTAVPTNTFDPDCVADGDAAMSQGAGTVFATVGTGGQTLRDVNAADSEVGYFAAYQGANRTPSHGFLDVRATADALQASFVRANGTFADAFTITRGAPPPNAAPTAAFTSTTSGLTATFDARGSSDPDGPISSYAWDFGDGTTGTGAQPQHPYAAAGTYDVTLSVTDGGGLTDQETGQVTVTAPPPSTVFVQDTFGRTVSNGLGTAEVGGAWTTSGTSSNFSVSSGSAALNLRTAGTTIGAWLNATTRTDTDLRMSLSVDKVPTSSLYLDVAGRRVNATNEYRARLTLLSSGQVNIAINALNGSTTRVVAPAIRASGVTYGPGTVLNVRMQATGTGPTTLRLKVWAATAPEPTAWQLVTTDSGAGLQAAGSVGLTAYLSSGATNAPVVLRMDDVSARPVG